MNYKGIKKTCLLIMIILLYPLYVNAQGVKEDWATIIKEVLSHYENKDSDLIAASKYLLDNAPYHFSKVSDSLTDYYSRLSKINSKFKFPDCKDEIASLYDSIDTNIELKTVNDTSLLTTTYIINNIDSAYRCWKEGDYSKHVSLNQFCEYLLPYRIGNEQLECWRKELNDKYIPRIDWMRKQDDKKNSSYWAALYVNDQIKKLGFHIVNINHYGGIDLPIRCLKNIRMGECEDYAELTAYIMRACGIPVGIDFTPQWPFRSSGHYWNTLLDNSGKNIPFMGGESNPGYPCKAGYPMAKVYRKTFAYQENSLFELNKQFREPVPELLNTPFIKDVTNEYVKGVDVKATINKQIKLKRNFIYLSVFNNQQWTPIAFTTVDEDGCGLFQNIGPGVVYLPTIWTLSGERQSDFPVEVKPDGSIVKLKPDVNNKKEVTLNRKFPVFGGVLSYSQRVVGGYFECANSRDFSDAVKCGVIEQNPEMRYDSIEINNKGKYRYWRYVSPKNSHCNIAEIKYFYKNEQLQEQLVFADETGTDPQKAFDNDELTFYESGQNNGGWIGVDFGRPIKVSKVVYLPRNDDNNVVPNHLYQLCYYGENGMEIVDTKKAVGYSVTFNDVPTGALYILHDLTKGIEERNFTIENDSIVWH